MSLIGGFISLFARAVNGTFLVFETYFKGGWGGLKNFNGIVFILDAFANWFGDVERHTILACEFGLIIK